MTIRKLPETMDEFNASSRFNLNDAMTRGCENMNKRVACAMHANVILEREQYNAVRRGGDINAVSNCTG